ncbi:hypothetical protein BDB01DRAFT_786654 [Pilobolus umbonatus]|nr:hypothetical protein BDB01DRAFT_786654 [Pilobolus umbonatus]
MDNNNNNNSSNNIHQSKHTQSQMGWTDTDISTSSRSTSPSPFQSECEDNNEIASQGFHRFRLNDNDIRHKSARTASISEYCSESFYSYSFTPLSRVNKATRMKKEILNRGMDYMQHIRSKLGEDTGRRFSQPDIGVLDRPSLNNQPALKASPSMNDLAKTHFMQFDDDDKPDMSNEDDLFRQAFTHHLPSIQESHPTQLPPSFETQYNRALHSPSRFLPQNQAILTTSADGTILLFNDMASLCFGMNKTYIGKSVLPFIENPFQKQICYILNERRSLNTDTSLLTHKGIVLVCGIVMPIRKMNGDTSAASLWLKEKMTDDGKIIYIWIFEEIYETSLSVSIDQGRVVDIEGKVKDLFGYECSEVIGRPIEMLLPTSQQSSDPSGKGQVRYCGGKSKNGDCFPLMVTLLKNGSLMKIVSLPSIAGLITVHQSGRIQSISPVPAKYLFGYSAEAVVETFNINQIIPQYSELVDKLQRFNLLNYSHIVNNHTCRYVLSDKMNDDPRDIEFNMANTYLNNTGTPIIYAVHSDKSQFEIQLQLRLMKGEHEDLVSLWVTYDRIQAFKRSSKRKISVSASLNKEPPSKLVNMISSTEIESPISGPIEDTHIPYSPLRSYGISSYGSVDRRMSIFPSHFYLKGDQDPSEEGNINIDNYTMIGTLGEGAYGTAKLAYMKDDPTKKKYVIKCISKSKIVVDSWIRDRKLGMVPLEIHILKKLKDNPHKNCCSLVTYMEDEDSYYIVMKLYGENSVDLFDYIELNEQINENDIKNIFRQIAEAVDHLHSLNIVHRDIKDENILLDEDGCAHLIDFGSAAYYKPGRMFDTFGGTLDYCAPEILKGMSYEGPPQDIWSLGTLLYTLICRENPFYNVDEIMERDLRIPFVLSKDSLDLIKHMLDRDVKERYTIKQVLSHPWLNGH